MRLSLATTVNQDAQLVPHCYQQSRWGRTHRQQRPHSLTPAGEGLPCCRRKHFLILPGEFPVHRHEQCGERKVSTNAVVVHMHTPIHKHTYTHACTHTHIHTQSPNTQVGKLPLHTERDKWHFELEIFFKVKTSRWIVCQPHWLLPEFWTTKRETFVLRLSAGPQFISVLHSDDPAIKISFKGPRAE